ncbi:MAG TPA: flagellar hook-length control protein FliK [Burkholderiaceae bacterium]
MKIGSHELLTTMPAAANANANGNGPSMASSSNFAALLQQQQNRAPVVAPAPSAMPTPQARPSQAHAAIEEPEPATNEAAAKPESDATDDTTPSDAAAPQTRPAAKPRMRGNDAPTASRTARDARNDGSGTESADSARRDHTAVREGMTDTATTNDPKTGTAEGNSTLPNWLAGLLPSPAQPTTAGSASGTAADAAAELDAADAPNAGGSRGRGLSLAAGRKAGAHDTAASTELDTLAAATRDNNGAASATSNFTTLLAEQQSRAEPAGARGDASQHDRIDASTALAHGATAAAATATPSGTAAADASGTSAAHVRAAVGSPEFPQELGVQLSVLARDGVQQAELHLNPAEMGPVSVQIVMDGTQARIDFGADVAATRQAIEAGLPELASALRDAGFTLAGGGVSQHAGGRQGSDGDTSRRDGGSTRRIGGSAADEGGSTARVMRTRVSAGGVDLYA